MAKKIREVKLKRKKRTASKFIGKIDVPQLKVFRSNKSIYAQVIDTKKNVTIAWENNLKLNDKEKKTKTQKAKEVGLRLAKKLLKLKINRLIFNRGSYQYTGRVKALVEGVREGGIKV
jgi:large subunit ribosomal protein L18